MLAGSTVVLLTLAWAASLAAGACDDALCTAFLDRLNHMAGDRFLVRFAGMLGAALREGDEAARIGGDEFLVLLSGVHDLPETAVPLFGIVEDLGKFGHASICL